MYLSIHRLPYTDLEISWHGLKLRIQSCTSKKDISFLLTPMDENRGGDVLICPGQKWWDRDGRIAISEKQIMFDLPSGKIHLYAKGQ